MKRVLSALSFAILSAPSVSGAPYKNELCYSEELFIMYAAKNFETVLAQEKHREYVESESGKVIEHYRAVEYFPSVADHYAGPEALQEICDRLGPEKFRKLVFYFDFFEMSTQDPSPPEQ